jgi:hypothetical protein
MQTVITLTELAERWGVAPNSVRNMEQDGKLHRLQYMPGCRYSMAEVYQLESIGLAAKGLTAWERKQKDDEIASLRQQVSELQGRLAKVMAIAQGGAL